MNVVHLSSALPAKGTPLAPSCLSIGSFDGCHRGHQHLLQATCAYAKSLGVPASVMIFTPPPSLFFHKREGGSLFTPSQYQRAFQELGIETLFIQTFDADFAQLPPEAFYLRLRETLNVRGIVVGADFSFGQCRSGNVDFLRQKTRIDHLFFEAISCTGDGDAKVSSSTIREQLEHQGDLSRANCSLGRPYLVEGALQALYSEHYLLHPDCQLVPTSGRYEGHIWTRPTAAPVLHMDPSLPTCILSIESNLLILQFPDGPPLDQPSKNVGIYLTKRLA